MSRTMPPGTAERCPACAGSGWVQPYGFFPSALGGDEIRKFGAPHQCTDCHGTGYRRGVTLPNGQRGQEAE